MVCVWCMIHFAIGLNPHAACRTLTGTPYVLKARSLRPTPLSCPFERNHVICHHANGTNRPQ